MAVQAALFCAVLVAALLRVAVSGPVEGGGLSPELPPQGGEAQRTLRDERKWCGWGLHGAPWSGVVVVLDL